MGTSPAAAAGAPLPLVTFPVAYRSVDKHHQQRQQGQNHLSCLYKVLPNLHYPQGT